MTGALRWAWDFVVGDDWRTAVGVAAVLALTALLAAGWVLVPIGVCALLGASLRRAAAQARSSAADRPPPS